MVPAVQVEAVLCVALAPPASAAKWLRWEWLTQAAQVVTPVVVRRGPEWCAAFVPAADKVPSRADSWGLSQAVYEVLRETVDAHDLPTPVGGPFVEGWMQAITPSIDWQQGRPNIPDQEEVVRRLRAEPRLTDLVAPTLAHPQIGQHAYLAAGLRDPRRRRACWHASSSCTCAWPVSTRPAGRRPRRRSPRRWWRSASAATSCPAAWPGCSS